MLIIITYDVSTETKEGKRRLVQVARCCASYGQRVQNSVFECNLDYGQYIKLQNKLEKIINSQTDSLRYYNLGNNYNNKVLHIGVKPSIPIEGTLLI